MVHGYLLKVHRLVFIKVVYLARIRTFSNLFLLRGDGYIPDLNGSMR